MSHLGGSLSQLVESRSYLEESWTIWKGPGVSCEGLGAQGEEGGDRQRERDRTEHSWYVMEPWVIFPIGAAAQKPKLCQKQFFKDFRM